MSDTSKGRTHEPDLRELAAEFDGFVKRIEEKFEGFIKLMDERQLRNDDRFNSQDEKTSLAVSASEKASTKAETAIEKRFDSVNEFRGAMNDSARLQLPRAEADSRFASLEQKLEEMKKRYDTEIAGLREARSEGMGRQQVMTIVISIAVSIAVALGNILFKH
jgi:predicted  nucleic acid-binding Zn-ribbon protein